MSRVAAIVPALDEESSIEGVVRGLLRLPCAPTVFVVDDGSTDATAEAAARAGATVLRLPFNCGIGAAVQTGLRAALQGGFERMIRLDGDDQHDPADVARLLAPLDQQADFVLGSRHLEREGFQTSRPRRIGIRWFSLLVRALSGLRVTDPTSGFWAANARAASILVSKTASDYPEVDALMHLWRAGLSIREEPVRMRPRASGLSSIAGRRSLYYMIKVTVALLAVRLGSTPDIRASDDGTRSTR
jgi:glycosyltransferase involved in cell wall biosynthesis